MRANNASSRHCVLLGAAIIVLMLAFGGFTWAKSGLSRKEPVPFAKWELTLVHECRGMLRSQGIASAVFVRKCSSVMAYVLY